MGIKFNPKFYDPKLWESFAVMRRLKSGKERELLDGVKPTRDAEADENRKPEAK